MTHNLSKNQNQLKTPKGLRIQSENEITPPKSKPRSKESNKAEKRRSGSNSDENLIVQSKTKKPCASNYKDTVSYNPTTIEQISLLSDEENTDNNSELRNSFLSIPPVKHSPPGMLQEIQTYEKRD